MCWNAQAAEHADTKLYREKSTAVLIQGMPSRLGGGVPIVSVRQNLWFFLEHTIFHLLRINCILYVNWF